MRASMPLRGTGVPQSLQRQRTDAEDSAFRKGQTMPTAAPLLCHQRYEHEAGPWALARGAWHEFMRLEFKTLASCGNPERSLSHWMVSRLELWEFGKTLLAKKVYFVFFLSGFKCLLESWTYSQSHVSDSHLQRKTETWSYSPLQSLLARNSPLLVWVDPPNRAGVLIFLHLHIGE